MDKDNSFFSFTRKQGILSYPFESFASFKKRVGLLKENRQSFFDKEKDKGMTKLDFFDDPLQVNTLLFLKESSKDLRFWEAAATWTVEYNSTFLSYIQIKNKKRTSYEEIIRHEAIHEMRQGFKENIFEEFLAYRTSKNFFRRIFGPIFFSPKETMFFVIAFYISLAIFFFTEEKMCLACFAVVVVLLMVRLIVCHLIFLRCLKKLAKIFSWKEPLAIAVSLTDKEILAIACKKNLFSLSQIHKENSPRWQQILDTFT